MAAGLMVQAEYPKQNARFDLEAGIFDMKFI